MTPAEAAATALAPLVQPEGWTVVKSNGDVYVMPSGKHEVFACAC